MKEPHPYGYRCFKTKELNPGTCDQCENLRGLHAFCFTRHGTERPVCAVMKRDENGVMLSNVIGGFCGRRCAKRYARSQFALLRLQGKI